MKPLEPHVLVLNGGSSSIRFGVYRRDAVLERLLHGKLDRIGQRAPLLTFMAKGGQPEERPCTAATSAATDRKSVV